jgi:NADH dehydrogenase
MSALAPNSLVTVIGGSGFIGRYAVQMLAEHGFRLRVVVRNAQTALFLKPLGDLGQIEIVAGDIRSDADMVRAFAGAAAGVNLVGILAEGGGRTFTAIQAEGAGRAARAAAAAGIGRYVQVSAIGADAASPSAYGRTKAAGEAAVRAALPGAVILRPSIVFGPEDQFFNRFADLATLAPVMPVISGRTRFQPVHVLNVAEAITHGLIRDDTAGQTYELGGPGIYSFRELLAMILKDIGRNIPLVEVPDGIARLMGAVGNVLPFVPMTSDQFAMLQKDNVCAPGVPGLAALGITPTPVEAIIPGQLARFRKGGRFATLTTATAA